MLAELHDETGQWREAVCQALMTLPDPNICLLRFLLRFLRHYDQHGHRAQCHHHTSGGVAAIFSPLLIQKGVEQSERFDSIQQLLAHQLMNKLIHESNHIFQDRWVHKLFKMCCSKVSLTKESGNAELQNFYLLSQNRILAELKNDKFIAYI